MTYLFFDTEFTGLHQNTTLISLGIVSEEDDVFYAEFTDYNRDQVNDWITENVLNQMILKEIGTVRKADQNVIYVKGDRSYVKASLCVWLAKFDKNEVRFWGDTLHYDWVLFCELFGGALNIPANIRMFPMDIRTVLEMKNIQTDYSLIEFKQDLIQSTVHNALYDALIVRKLYYDYVR